MKLPEEKALSFQFPAKLRMICITLIVSGLILIGLQVAFPWHPAGVAEGEHGGANARLFLSLHMGLLLAIPLALGGIYFVAFNNLAGAAWCVTIRRIAENYFWYLVVVLALMAVIFLVPGGLGSVFGHWGHAPESDHVLAVKRPWLNPGFFVARNFVIVAVWFIFGFVLWKKSVGQDSDPSISHTRSLAKWSAVFIILFALSYSANSWDMSMSLEPHWFSTMWGPYCYAGLALTAFSSIILWIWYLKGSGYFGETLNENHYHDMGKYMWGHSIFWGYTMICQYLLIWYAHIPEETILYRIRIYTPEVGFQPWAIVSLLLVVVRFLVPFFLIIQRKAKRNLNRLALAAAIVLFGQIVDIFWIAYPTLEPVGSPGIVLREWYQLWRELGPIAVVLGSFVWVVGSSMARNSLIPKGDPRLEECLHMHQ